MNKKYCFFDIDGTLTDIKTGKIVPSALTALKELQDNGHFVCLATGRAHYKAVNTMEDLGLKNMVCNGGNGLVINHEFVQNIPLDKEIVLDVINQANKNNVGWLVAIDDSIDVYSINDLFEQQVGPRQEPTNYYYDSNFDLEKVDTIYKVYLALDRKAQEDYHQLDNIGHLRFIEEYLMLQPDNKKQGIIDMVNHLGGNLEDVVVFGDDYNDLVMFDSRWTSIAMGNACDVLKEKADIVTKRNIDDGIYYICKKNGWI